MKGTLNILLECWKIVSIHFNEFYKLSQNMAKKQNIYLKILRYFMK